MPDRAMEERHLVAADRLIDEGERRVEAMERHLSLLQGPAEAVELAIESLRFALETLASFRAHRSLILAALADLDASGA